MVTLLFLATRKFYLGGSWGFVDSREDDSKTHAVDREKLSVVIGRFLVGDAFDMLWVGRIDDEYSGLIINLENNLPVGTLYLKTKGEAEQISDFLIYLLEAGYEVQESCNGFNGGTSEEHRQTCLEFPIENSTQAVLQAIDRVLDRMQPTEQDTYYVSGSRSFDRGRGIKVGNLRDPLANLL